ncbi:MAG: hypothetical protein MJE77_19670 [Proteobacteria bacterium]|nr:hypothetical protein [Pseudomonadota bacterium]
MRRGLPSACAITALLVTAAAGAGTEEPGQESVKAGPVASPGQQRPDLDPAEAIEVAPENSRLDGEFRMEGAAELELVFADSEQYKRRIDRFYATAAAMDEQRRRYFRHLLAALQAMGYTGTVKPAKRRSGCPRTVAEPYRLAYRAGQRYRALGLELETDHALIREFDRLGESAGLTPDYRWKVNRVRHIYRTGLADYREMRAAMLQQIQPELRVRRCNHRELMSERAPAGPEIAADTGEDAKPAEQAPMTPNDQKSGRPAAPVTFFIDNRACQADFEFYLSGQRAGRVPAGQRVAFQSGVGRRRMCLLPGPQGDSAARPECGRPGTLRTAYIHAGWTLVTECQEARDEVNNPG